MKKLDVNDYSFYVSKFCPVHLNTIATLPCEMQNSLFGRLQQ